MHRYFKYDDLDGVHTVTDEEILREYFPYWQEQMRKVGREHMISPENCIEDFVAVNWAEEVTPDATVNKLTPPSKE
jgi:hypothetical protein